MCVCVSQAYWLIYWLIGLLSGLNSVQRFIIRHGIVATKTPSHRKYSSVSPPIEWVGKLRWECSSCDEQTYDYQ